MEPDILTNAMTREVMAPIQTAAEQAIDIGTKYDIPAPWVFACLVVIVMGKSLGRMGERVTGHFFPRGKED